MTGKLRKIREGVYTSDSKPRKVDDARVKEILENVFRPSVVYMIDVFSDQETHLPSLSSKFRHRNWGFYFKLEDAQHVVENNETDISELDYYHFALISKKGQGPLAISEAIQWYEFIWDDARRNLLEVRKIECPEQYKNIVA